MHATVLKEMHHSERKLRAFPQMDKPQIRIRTIRLLAQRRINYAVFYLRLHGTYKGSPRDGREQRRKSRMLCEKEYILCSRDARMDGFNSFRCRLHGLHSSCAPIQTRLRRKGTIYVSGQSHAKDVLQDRLEIFYKEKKLATSTLDHTYMYFVYINFIYFL